LAICGSSIDECVDGLLNFLGCRFNIWHMPDILLPHVRGFFFGRPNRVQESLNIGFGGEWIEIAGDYQDAPAEMVECACMRQLLYFEVRADRVGIDRAKLGLVPGDDSRCGRRNE
jgi:hypothetical protein